MRLQQPQEQRYTHSYQCVQNVRVSDNSIADDDDDDAAAAAAADDDDDDDVELNVLGCRADILGTNRNGTAASVWEF